MLTLLCLSAGNGWADQPRDWYRSGEKALTQALNRQINTNPAKNIILFVGDGMGVTTVTAGRIYDGQSRGQSGEENWLSFEQLPAMGLAKTYNTNQQTPDSAGTMTAMVTGVKTKAGFISVDQRAVRGDCESARNNHIPTLLEQAERAGLSTGVVTTARLTHATPAATYAHVPERNWEDDADLPASAKQAGCRDIARQLIEFSHGNGLEVAMGGGLRSFIPATQRDPIDNQPGERQDNRDLSQEWQTRYSNSTFVWNREQLNALDTGKVDHLLGLFNRSHMRFYHDRKTAEATEPSLPEMTRKALEVLQKNSKGYFLMVEAGRIDHAHHAGNAHRALADTQEFSQAVAAALDHIDLEETLVIVTADHSHTLTIGGYSTRGNNILGKVVTNDRRGEPHQHPHQAQDDMPYTTLGYRNGQGLLTKNGKRRTGRQDISEVDTTAADYYQTALVPLPIETHGGEDVAIYAGGPWAHLFHRTHEQHYIYHVMRHALLDSR